MSKQKTPKVQAEAKKLFGDTPSSKVSKKLMDPEDQDDEEDDDDEDDMDERAVLGKKPTKKESKEEEEEEGDDDDEGDDVGDDEEENLYIVGEHLLNGNNLGICVPANSSINIGGYLDYPLRLTSACLGPNAVEKDRATLIAMTFSNVPDFEDDEDEDEHENGEHSHEGSSEVEEMVLGTLVMHHAENIMLDVAIERDFILANTSKESDIYLCARLDLETDEQDDEDDEYLNNYEGEFDEDEDEEDDEDVDMDQETSRLPVEDEEKPKPTPAKNIAGQSEQKKRKVVDEETNGGDSTSAKKQKTEPKVIDVKSASKPTTTTTTTTTSSATPGKPKGGKVSPDQVVNFLIGELKTKKSIKQTDIGSALKPKFGMTYKEMGFTEKGLTQFLAKHAANKIVLEKDSFKLKE